MKKTPQEKRIQQNLQPGVVTLTGFLGNDHRFYQDIIEEDKNMLIELCITPDEVADRLQYFTDLAWDSYDGPIIIDDVYQVEYKSYRGKIPCPFLHPGLFPKGTITLRNLFCQKEICWTPLNIHMIRKHCFFEGKGTPHRIEPNEIIEILFCKES